MSEHNLVYQVTGKVPFDFSHPRFQAHKNERIEFYFKNHHKAITEDEFVRTVLRFPYIKEGVGKKARRNRNPSYVRTQYRKLVERYGFFPGGQNDSSK